MARALVGILSDGMSSRLFTEVREKRGLVYSVFATCFSLAAQGCVLCYAGTTTNRAEETLHVLIETINSLGTGISQDELERLKNRSKSSLVMEQESSTDAAVRLRTIGSRSVAFPLASNCANKSIA